MARNCFYGLALALPGALAHAGSCCGGGSSLPSLITGDDRGQISTSFSQAYVIGDAPVAGLPVFRDAKNDEELRTFSVAGAFRISDRFQSGIEVPVVNHSHDLSNASSADTAMGDVKVNLAYEALPEWGYSPWRPHGFAFLDLLVPTGKSLNETNSALGLDAAGLGAWSVGLGAHLLKVLGRWDAFFTFEGQRIFASLNSASDGNVRLLGGWGLNGAVGLGYSPGAGSWRIGLSLNPVYQGPQATQGDDATPTSEKLLWNTGLQISYMPRTGWSVSASYIDQTLVGPARNTPLTRAAGLSLQKRWEL